MADIKVRRRPERNFADVLAEARAARKTGKADPIRKSTTLIRAADAEGAFDAATMTPTDEQLAQINQFTRTPKTAEQLVVLPMWACNDLVDRDIDRFRTEAIRSFASLPQPFSPIGKSFMIGHDYTKLPVGRIFDAKTEVVEGVTFLKVYAYMPNTAQYAEYLENVDFGIHWAVSVGVVFNDAYCNVGDEHPWGYWGYWCDHGHEKGLYYDPKSDKTDSWGYPLPVDAGAKGAELCVRDLANPSDFYEISQVYLGAQFYAELEKGALALAIKSAGAAKVLTLSGDEAKKLPRAVPEDEGMRTALFSGKAALEDDGSVVWTDKSNLRWKYSPSSDGGEVVCLGASADDADEDDNEDTDKEAAVDYATEVTALRAELATAREAGALGAEQETLAVALEAILDEVEAAIEAGADELLAGLWSAALAAKAKVLATEEPAEGDDTDDVPTKAAKVVNVTRASVLAAAQRVGVSATVMERIRKAAPGAVIDEVLRLVVEGESKITELTPRAALGDEYVEELRVDARKCYARAHYGVNRITDEGVDMSACEEMLALAGDNAQLIQRLRNGWKRVAQDRFPQQVRRSTADPDPNEVEGVTTQPSDIDERSKRAIKGLHG